jgi:hypothetical protein
MFLAILKYSKANLIDILADVDRVDFSSSNNSWTCLYFFQQVVNWVEFKRLFVLRGGAPMIQRSTSFWCPASGLIFGLALCFVIYPFPDFQPF